MEHYLRIALPMLAFSLVLSSCRGQERTDATHAEPAPPSSARVDAGWRATSTDDAPDVGADEATDAVSEEMPQPAPDRAPSPVGAEPDAVAIDRLVQSDAIYAISADQTVLRDPRRAIPPCDESSTCDTKWIDLRGELPDDAVRVSIDAKKARALLQILSSPAQYGGAPAGCYDPRLQVAFYRDGETTPWATVGVCIECMNTYSWPPVPEIAEAPDDKTGYGLRPTGVRAWCRDVGLQSCVNHRTYVEKQ